MAKEEAKKIKVEPIKPHLLKKQAVLVIVD